MPSLLHLLRMKTSYDISVCVPIYDDYRRRDIEVAGIRVYAFDGGMDRDEIRDGFISEFKRIFEIEKPDIIHIWGTEYKHAYYAVMACKELDLLDRTVIDIQGIITFIARHYLDGIPESIITLHTCDKCNSYLIEEKNNYLSHSALERKIYQMVRFVTGRTDWDLSCVDSINHQIKYFYNARVLREGFYDFAGKWDSGKCKKHSVFLSSAYYALKGFHLFINVINELRQRFGDLSVVIAGPDPLQYDKKGERSEYGNYIEELLKENNLENITTFIGIIDESEMIERMLEANVFVATSTIENSCNSLCEAMMLGLPVVATYCGGLPSLINHSVDGFLYQSNASYMGAYYIGRIFEDHFLAERLSCEETKTALNRHDKERILNNVVNMYDTIGN